MGPYREEVWKKAQRKLSVSPTKQQGKKGGKIDSCTSQEKTGTIQSTRVGVRPVVLKLGVQNTPGKGRQEGCVLPRGRSTGKSVEPSFCGERSLYLSGGVCACNRNREEMLRDSVLSSTRTGPPASHGNHELRQKAKALPQILLPLEGNPKALPA